MSTLINSLRKKRRPLSWLAGGLFAYALLGFFLLPRIIESQAIAILDERLALDTVIDEVYFNPFSFYFELRGLSISDTEQGELFELGDLNLNFQASRLFLLKLQFASINIADLDVYYARSDVGLDTITTLSKRWSDTADTAVATSSDTGDELIPLEIISITLSNINTHILDQVPATPFTTSLSLTSTQIDGFSTLPDRSGNNAIDINFEAGANLNWQGRFSISPMQFDGQVALQNFSLLPVSRYLQDTLPFAINSGLADLAFTYSVDLSQSEPVARLDDVDFALRQLSATQNGESEPFIESTLLSLDDGLVSIPANRAEFSRLQLQQWEIAVTRREDGSINLQDMLASLQTGNNTDTDPQVAQDPGATQPWFVSLESLELANNQLRFLDTSLQEPFDFSTSFDATINNIDNQDDSTFPLIASLGFTSGGEIAINGQLQAFPTPDLQSEITVTEIAINAAQPYVSELAFLELDSGALDLQANVEVNDSEPFALRGDVELKDLAISDQQLNETLFSMTSLAVDALQLSLADNELEISEVTLEDFFARVLINEDGSSNIGRSVKTDNTATTTESASDSSQTTSESMAITVGQVNLMNASADFTDLDLPLPFNANIQNLAGAVQGFASNSSASTSIDLEGQVDEFGLVQITSELNPFDFTAQSQIDVNFTNIDMPSMSPYVIKFAGREIAEGRVDLGLTYALDEGKLDANNQMVLSALELGDRIEQPGAMDLPLDLALALLKDGDGVIDLEVPITGDVNDPEFDFGPAIRRAITNILTNIVAAPFRMLGSLLGGDGNEGDLEHIRFMPGRFDIAAPEQETLLSLATALQQRPQLVLEIPAVTNQEDIPALQTLLVDAKIESALVARESTEESLTGRRQAVIEALYASTDMEASLAEIRLLHTQIPDSDTAAANESSSSEFDTLAYIADLRDRLITAQVISESEIGSLAEARRNSVIEFLSTNTEIEGSRITATNLEEVELDEDGWLLLTFGLSASR